MPAGARALLVVAAVVRGVVCWEARAEAAVSKRRDTVVSLMHHEIASQIEFGT